MDLWHALTISSLSGPLKLDSPPPLHREPLGELPPDFESVCAKSGIKGRTKHAIGLVLRGLTAYQAYKQTEVHQSTIHRALARYYRK